MKVNQFNQIPSIETQDLLEFGYWEWDLNSNSIFFSEKLQSILGLKAEAKYLYSDFLKIISLFDRERIKEEMSDFVLLQKSFSIEFRIFKHGELHYLVMHGSPIFNAQNKLQSFTGIGQLITEKRNLLTSLQTSNNHLLRTQRIANIGNWVWDISLKKLTCDDAMHSIFGVVRNDLELSFRNLRTFFSPMEWKKCLLFIRKHIDTKQNGWFEQKIFSGNGKQIDIAIFFEFDFNEMGLVKTVYGIIQDISKQKLVQEQLRYRIEFERMVGAISSNFINLKSSRIDAGIKLALDIIGTFMNVNRSYLFLFSDSNVNAKLCYQWHSDFVKNFGDENQTYLVADFPLLFGTILRGETLFIDDTNRIKKNFQVEKEFLSKNGVQSIILVPLGLEGKVIGGMGFDSARFSKAWSDDEISLLRICGEIFVNALSRKKNDLETKQNEEHVSIILDSIGDAVIAIDDKNVIVKVNSSAEHLTNYSKSDLIGMKIEEILHYSESSDQNFDLKKILSDLKFQEGRNWEIWKILTRDRRLLSVSLNSAPLKVGGITITGTVIVCREITNQIKLEEQLRHSEKMRVIGQLSGGIAHDFNNLLTGIIGCANYLKKHLKEKKELLEYVENILITGRRAANLTSQLLAFSRSEKPHLAEINLDFLINDVFNLLVHTIDPIIQMQKNFNSPHSVLEGDESQLHNAILNLAVNARDAMPNGGVILFSTSFHEFTIKDCVNEFVSLKPGRYIAISVRDNGCGIPNELISHIFEPFFTTKEKGKGTGLGLAAVYGTVLAHHGCITVKSQLNTFTEFSLYLPLLDKNFILVAAPDKVIKTITTNKRILVVDDEVLLCSLVCELLTDAGYLVCSAYNGIDALNIYKNEFKNIDLVLVDMLMPSMNGPELLEKMNVINPQIKAIVISGFTGNLDLKETLNNKIPFLQKPYEESHLLKLIEQVLSV